MADDDQSAFDDPLEARLRAYATASPDGRSAIAKALFDEFEPAVTAAWDEASLSHVGMEHPDFLQNVFMEVFDHLHQVRTREMLQALVLQTTRDAAAAAVRRHATEPETVGLDEARGLSIRIDRVMIPRILLRSYLDRLSPAERRGLERKVPGLDPVGIWELLQQKGPGDDAFRRVISKLRSFLELDARRLQALADDMERKKRS